MLLKGKGNPTEVLAPQVSTAIRGMRAQWIMRGQAASADQVLLQRVLGARGLLDGQAAQTFLSPALAQLHDPSLMPGLDKAAQRLVEALRNKEKIVIYGDYDVDGVTATSVLFHAMKCLAPEAEIGSYVPHRIDEGYGLNADALRQLAEQGANVIVTVDCGITASAQARELHKHTRGKVDLIITDHHNLPHAAEDLPEAFALVHPRLPGSAYPFGELCGAGVAYKLAWRIGTLWSGGSRVPEAMRVLLVELLALVSMGVVADVVPLVDENRVLASFGLARIKNSPLPGLKELVAASGLDSEKIAADDVGFKLGPRLNACGRLGHARAAVELLTVAQGQRAIDLASELDKQNESRRAVEREIVRVATEMAHAADMTKDSRRAIVLAHDDWHAGVVGIACSRLVEQFHRPVILMGRNEEHFHGSGRSVHGFSLHAALTQCSHLLESYGGHDMAAGVRIKPEKLREFQDAFVEVANRKIEPEQLCARIEFDTNATIRELTPAAVLDLRRLEPFGRDNPRVLLRLPSVRLQGRAELMGKDLNHVALRVGDDSKVMRIVGWRMSDIAKDIPPGAMLDLIIYPRINEWQDRRTVEGELIDLRVL